MLQLLRGSRVPLRRSPPHRRPPATVVPALLALLGLVAGCRLTGEGRDAVRGPLAQRVIHPLSLTFLAPRPRRAATQARGTTGVEVSAQHVSLHELFETRSRRVSFDGELTRGSLRLRHGLTERMDIELELGALYASAGFLDGTVEAFHDAFLLPDSGRSLVPKDRYSMHLEVGDSVVYDLEGDRLGFADLPLFLTRNLVREEGALPGVALRLGVELPTGSARRGFGSGRVDWGAGLILEKSLGRFTLGAAVDWIDAGNPRSFEAAGLEARDSFSGQLGLEFRAAQRLSLLAQLVGSRSLLPEFGLEEVDEDVLDLGVGFARDLSGSGRLVVSFHEDLVALAGPDFGIRVALVFGF